MSNDTPKGLTSQIKGKLIQQMLARKLQQAAQPSAPVVLHQNDDIPAQFYQFDLHPGYQQVKLMRHGAERLGAPNPFFHVHEGTAGATCVIEGRQLINFASYNYLGLSGHPEVNQAAKDAIDQYGTSVSASRIVSGERPLHRQLERAIALAYDTDDALALVSGHATNTTVIGYLFGPRDLVIHDELAHNSVVQGAELSGATRLSFPHNDWQALDKLLSRQRRQFERVLIVIEGIYSMDGDLPDLPRFSELRHRHRAFLMVDEAHSFGVLGATGLGIREHFGLGSDAADIWMGTLSKTLAGCGGYIAGETALVDHLRMLAPGFLYSVGMPPAVAGAALAALNCMQHEPERIARLQARSQYFLNQVRQAGLNTGHAQGYAVIPAIVGSSVKAAQLSAAMLDAGINVQPVLYPAVPEKSARLRFFICSEHTEAQLDKTIQTLAALTR